ncbi:nucleic acid/nucleotide deaminase domain-containing protein [Kitasatospora sp. NBC_00315]|uniref:nucleic acid/nucleotide deaminase domain-containing protein n=1 Tax=Kitasatospora sp. NBC_00315 TaxID=2975963 RepID=UPI00324FB476
MSDDLAAALLAHFGERGLRSLDIAPPGPLRTPGLPLQVGRYFTAAEPSEPLSLGEFAAVLGWDAGAAAGQLRIGADRGAQFYLAPDRSVRAVVLGTSIPELPVNSSVEAFAAGLLLLDRRLPEMEDAQDPEAAFGAYLALRGGLLELDPAAFEERESWWPRVLDDLRLPLNVDSSAAFGYLDADGGEQIATAVGGPGLPHPEELLWHRLRAEGVEPEQVTRVYCELEPCLMPGHYCALWLADTFTDAQFTHAFDYGASAQSREDGVKALMVHLAERSG